MTILQQALGIIRSHKCIAIAAACRTTAIYHLHTNNVFMNKTLHLVLTQHWFDRIASGQKTSEYRACTPYWNRRLTNTKYDTVIFHRGYTNITISRRIISIDITSATNDLNLPKCWEIKLD